MNTKVEEIDEIEAGITRKQLIIWESIGWVVIFGFGSLFHFIYEWAPWKGYAWFFAINESMWEHSKLSFYPALLFYLVQFFVLRKKSSKMVIAGAISLPLGIVAMQSIYYTIEGAFGSFGWALSMGTFAAATIIQQIVHYLIMRTKAEFEHKKQLTLDIISLVMIVLLLTMMILFTYIQPEIPIFYDDYNGLYGFIPEVP